MNTADTTPQTHSGKDANKIYFLIAVILALLGTNAYLFFKDKKANDRIVTITDEKSSMATEIDKIEAELDKANVTLEQSYNSNSELTQKMRTEQEQARTKIAELRQALKKGQLTKGQLAKAQEDIKQLRYFVTKYASDIEDLKNENRTLTVERDSLKSTVATATAQAEETKKLNEELTTKVKAAAALKSAAISVTPLRIKNSGKETDVTRASTAKKFRINFSVIDNSLAEKGLHDVYLRVIDPNGNLLANPGNGIFIADGDEMQYSYRTAIEYANDGKPYSIDWTNPNPFEKGTYTIILYADGFTMGRTSLSLR
jgi:predicted  nucleic acid-binding Zn-ribbon protein